MRTLQYGSRQIPYRLELRDRKTLAITVFPDLSVRVRAPRQAADAAIEQVLRRRASWILRQQRFFAQFQPRTPPREYVSGETHLYLGRQYRLRVRAAEREGVGLNAGYLYVFTPEPGEAARVRQLLARWYRARARRWFRTRLGACLRSAAGRGLDPPRLQIRRMAARWGSCGPSGTLTLNVDLIRAPRACVDYVIVHELCHLRHPNHSPEFYRLLETSMPDWRERKLRLEKMLA
jgi:predicted metal-dependent hydrolase